MKLCILGAGAIGGYLAAKLSLHAHVTLIARGATLDAIRNRGLVLVENGATHSLSIEVASPDDTIEQPDVLIIAKLWGNMTINPIAAVSGATADQILDEPLCVEWCTAVMHEASAIGAKIDCYIDQSPQDRHNVTRKLGDFKPSMLQDVEMGKPIELESLVGVVHELGRVLNVPTPNTNALLGIMRLFARTNGLVPSK